MIAETNSFIISKFTIDNAPFFLKLPKEEFKLKIILAITSPSNNNSIKLIKKLGLSYQKRIKPFDDDEEVLLFAKTL
ncbi:hypothetical protein [Ichthyenterobacterium magnum]|uniref:hypothetical protein n=1 Tax=Ichthyenterobacterium magnum TaxID=1230530 RepID=UPI001B85D3E7|nr:hypothetical protein [Ichthyenterobacterium magnum]